MAGSRERLYGRGRSRELADQRQEQNILGQEENISEAIGRAGWEERGLRRKQAGRQQGGEASWEGSVKMAEKLSKS